MVMMFAKEKRAFRPRWKLKFPSWPANKAGCAKLNFVWSGQGFVFLWPEFSLRKPAGIVAGLHQRLQKDRVPAYHDMLIKREKGKLRREQRSYKPRKSRNSEVYDGNYKFGPVDDGNRIYLEFFIILEDRKITSSG